MSAIDADVPTIAVGVGNSVQLYARGRIIAAALRNGRGWHAHVDGRTVEAHSLDQLLVKLGLLADHHAGGGR